MAVSGAWRGHYLVESNQLKLNTENKKAATDGRSYLLQVRLDAVNDGAALVHGLEQPQLVLGRPRREVERRQPLDVRDDRVLVVRRHSRKRRVSDQQSSLLIQKE